MKRTSLPVLALILVSLLAACGGDEEALFDDGKGGTSAGGQGRGGGAGQAGSVSNGGQGQAGQQNAGGAAGLGGGQGGYSGSGEGGSSYGGSGFGGSGFGGSSYGGAAGCAADPVTAPTNGACVTTGSPGYQCNPITNSPCNVAAGEACDFDGSKFVCFPGSNTQTACQACNSSLGPFCAGGYTCYGGKSQCTRFCCSNADCAPGTSCMMQPPTTLGICQAASNSMLTNFQASGGGGTGGSGQGGSGGNTTACAHSPCTEGAALDMACDGCVGMLCMLQAGCCTTTWDSTCVAFAQQFCGCTP